MTQEVITGSHIFILFYHGLALDAEYFTTSGCEGENEGIK
jgi:hypothetical protein